MSATFRERAGATLAPPVMALLEVASRTAQEHGSRLLVVGGLVRDVLLGRPTEDVDLVLAGPAEAFAPRLAAALEAAIEAESRFGTWRLALADGRRLDLAAARRETYPAPGSLPETRPAGLEEDLARRDFTVNAMAVDLAGSWGPLFDPHRGRDDLEGGLLRVLHPESFNDDPTRILRGLELAERLGFEFATETAAAARRALAAGALDPLSPVRFRTAWQRAFGRLIARGTAALAAGLERAADLGLLAALAPGLKLDPELRQRAARLAARPATPGDRSEVLLRACAWTDRATARQLARRWSGEEAVAEAWGEFGSKLETLRRSDAAVGAPRISEIAAALAPFETTELELLALAAGGEFEALLERHQEVLGFALTISGRDLIAAGAASGPALGRALAATRAARLDGLIPSDEELAYAQRHLEADS